MVVISFPIYNHTADEIADISSDFRIGFGSFVDKRVSPFVSLDINRQEDPCLSGCVSTYSYRHHVDLTDDSQFFGVSTTYISVKVDIYI